MTNDYRLKNLLILAGIIVLAFFLRIHNIGKHGLAGDEKYSLFVSQFVTYEGNNQKNSVRKPDSPYFTPKEFWSEKTTTDFFDAIARVDTGNGALYTYTLHFWSELVGLEDGNLRLLSLIFNLLTMGLIYIFVRKHFNSTNLALLSAFLAAISPFYVTYSQVARNYAMQFFFALLATHLLLLIVEKFHRKQNTTSLLMAYGFSVLACELCHISTFPLFLIHGIYILMYHRNLRLILQLVAAMIIPLVGLVAWLKSDGGKWLFEYVAHSTDVYNEMARTNPDEYLSLATIPNIIKQIRHVISCSFISLEGLYLKVSGIKVSLIIFGLSIFAILSTIFLKNKTLLWVSIGLLSIVSVLTSSFGPIQGFIFFMNLFLLWYIIRVKGNIFTQSKNQLYSLLLLLVVLPFIFLILFALKDGNTFRIIPRYVGYAYSFGIIATALIIRYVYHLKDEIKYLFYAGFIAQFIFILQLNNNIWQDNPPRYFMSFTEPRIENPYKIIAEKIKQNYVKGDTVIYCSNYVSDVKEGTDMPQYSVVDAQLTNFYLPKNSDIIQRVNPDEEDKIIIKRKDNSEKLIFDLQGIKFRY